MERTGKPPAEQKPEGRLIEIVLERRKLSIRKAADVLPVSETRLRQIISGYQIPRAGTRVPVDAPADTLAKIALGIDITPEQLEQAERPDAAEMLRRRLEEAALFEQPSSESAGGIAEIREGLHDIVTNAERLVVLLERLDEGSGAV